MPGYDHHSIDPIDPPNNNTSGDGNLVIPGVITSEHMWLNVVDVFEASPQLPS